MQNRGVKVEELPDSFAVDHSNYFRMQRSQIEGVR